MKLALCALVLLAGCTSARQPTASRSTSTPSGSTSTPSGSRLSTDSVAPATDPIAAAISAAFNSYTAFDQIRAVIVMVDGRTRFEHYYSSSANESRNVFSVTKSVVSTLIGLAISEGRLRLDEHLSQMLPRYAAEMTPSVAGVTLRQLLTMTAGFPDTFNGHSEDEMFSAPDWVRYILKHQDSTPGNAFQYSDYGAQLLSPILAQATGQSVLAYARTHLFDPIGIPTTPADQSVAGDAHLAEYQRAGFAWPVDPQGFNTAFSNLKIRPRDMARFGQLFLQGGRWNGRQVVPASWVQQATAGEAGAAFSSFLKAGDFQPTGYGYLWWITTTDHLPAFFALGYGGQLIEIVPQRHLVIVLSTYLNPKNDSIAVVGGDDLQRLANLIVPAAN